MPHILWWVAGAEGARTGNWKICALICCDVGARSHVRPRGKLCGCHRTNLASVTYGSFAVGVPVAVAVAVAAARHCSAMLLTQYL